MDNKKVVGIALLAALAVAKLVRGHAFSSLLSMNYLPHRFCYLAQPGLVWTNVIADGLIAGSYALIFGCLFWLVNKFRFIPRLRGYLWIFGSFGSFVLACGVTHLMEVVTVWWPLYPLSAATKVICAAVSIPTAIVFLRVTPKLAANILKFLAGLRHAKRMEEEATANYQGQVWAINRSGMMIEFEMDGTIIKANDNYLRAFHYLDEDMTGKNHSVFVAKEYRESPEYKEFWEGLRRGQFQSGLFMRVDKMGNEVWMEATYNPIYGVERVPVKVVKFAANVTERVKAQLDLKDAQVRLQAILDNVMDGIITIDSAGHVLSMNASANRMFGYEAGEVVGQESTVLMPRPEPDRNGERLTGCVRVIGRVRELEGLTKTGRNFPMELRVSEMSLQGKTFFVAVARDISERSQQEKALRKSEEFLDRTGRLAGVGGWELDLLTQRVDWTAETFRIHGLERLTQPTLEEAFAFYAPEARPKVHAAVEKAIAEGISSDLVVPLVRADGRRIWASLTIAVEFAEGKPVRLVGAIQDVTAHVAEQLALQEANSRATLTAESGGIGIWEWDLVDDSLKWDPRMFQLYGLEPAGDLKGNYERWSSHVHPQDRAMVEQALRSSVEGLIAYDVGFRVVWDDGSIHHLRATGDVKRDESGCAIRVVGANWDITDLVVAGDTSRESMKIATDSARIKADFLANMSHEIRTPMNAILGMTHLALRAHPSDQQRGYLTKIGNASQSLLSIMNDILDFSKIEAGKLELERLTFSLDDVWNDLVDIVGDKARKKNVPILFLVSPETPRLLIGDPLRLGQILINLVNNAVKFTERGEIVVKVMAEEVSDDRGRLRFSIRDTGIGMSAEQIANLFQSFNQADSSFTRKYGGTGLGLAISKQLCEMMGGTIAVESELGKGSTFTFTTTIGIAKQDMPIAERVRRVDRQKESILLVDDSESARDVLAAMLRKHGYTVRGVSSGEESLLVLLHASQTGEPFDLVVMDWRLPGIDGMEASRRIRSQLELSRVPAILMVSAFDRDEVMSGHDGSRLDGFLIKPIQEAALLSQVAKILGTRGNDASAATPRPVTDLVGRRVLLVEDNEINRDLASELLADLGIVVTVAVDGQEGVDRVEAEPFDLVLMDIQMPVMDGLTATRQIRKDERFRVLPIVAMTAHAMSGDRERSLYAGMNDHLTKPINPALLAETLRRWMPAKEEVRTKPVDVVLQVSVVVDDGLPEQLPPFNMKAALERANGKPKLLRKMLFSFERQFADAGETMRGHIVEGRVDEAQRLAHSLKGIAATLEATELADAAASVEQAYRTGQTESLGLLVDCMDVELKPAIQAIRNLMGSLTRVSDETKPSLAPIFAEPVLSQNVLPLVLVVDDQTTTFDLLGDALSSDYTFLCASGGEESLTMATSRIPDVILLDVMMPGIDGYEVCRRLKANPTTREIPVIFITSSGDVAAETKGLELGGADYITKPVNPMSVRARIENQVKLRAAQARLNLLASTDSLTGLANRRRFDEMLAYEYARHARSGSDLSLVLLDIDHFKAFNDTYGHVCGDDCLRQVGQALARLGVRATDLAARYGGEEFVFLLPETDLPGAIAFAEKIRRCIGELNMPHSQSSAADHVTASVGAVSARCVPGRLVSAIVAQADQQLYTAKASGRNQVSAAQAV